MGRMYIVNHWSDAAAYSGEQIGERLKDSTALHFNRDGSANVELYSEETALAKKKTSIPLADRILPQAKRVRLLTEQLYELEAERKNGMDVHTYSQLRDILICKRNRAEELLKKAVSIKPTQPDEDDIDLYTDLPEDEGVYEVRTDVSPQRESDIGCQWIDDLSSQNSLKNILKKACIITRKVIHYKHKMSSYLNELKAV